MTRPDNNLDGYAELAKFISQYPDRDCKYWYRCVECPFLKCRLDCKRDEHFMKPILYKFVSECHKILPSIPVLQLAFKVSKRTIYRALNEERA
jgi:hypothetical protein